SNHGEVHGGAFAEGRFGQALALDRNGYVRIPDGSSLDFGTGDFSISFWMKTGLSGQQATLVGKGAGQRPSYAVDLYGGQL
ncbi:MAG: hypothetical protein AB1476_06100, partial [Candidatus Hadarchaeota archaeon]